MTINLADNSPRISYAVAQGATQTSFAVPFEFFADADLNVYVDGTLKTLTTHYTVSGGDGSTGTVTISVTGATGGSTVVITRDVALERTTDFPSSGPFQIGALNTELDRLTAIAADLDDKAGRALQVTDYDVATGLTLPEVNDRKGKTLAFNASSGAVEAGPSISDVQTVSAAAADIQTLAHIEDGTDATDAIQTVAGIASNVSTVAGVSSAVSTVAGISSNVTAVAADATDIGVVAGKAAEIGRLGTAQAVADLDILATTDAVSDMNTLAAISSNISTVAGISANVTSVAGVASLITSDFVADLNTLATTDIVSDLNTLATADIVSDLNTLATSDIVSDLNTLATADIVSDLNTLATTDIVSDLNTLATTDIVTDLNLLATSAIVEDLNLLATSTVIADMATLAGAGANPNISSLGVSGNITLADNGKAIFGAGSDLQIYHDGNSKIADVGGGKLELHSDGTGVFIQKGATEYMAQFLTDGAVSLYHDNAAKLATTSTGVDITGTLTSDGLTVNSGTNNTVAKFESSDAGAFIILEDSGSTNDGNRIAVEGDVMSFATGDSERMRIDSSGRVMIGGTTVTDVNMLNIQGSGASSNIGVVLNDTNTSKIYGIQNGGSQLRFHDYSASATRMLIDSSGNVGIGTSSPTDFTGGRVTLEVYDTVGSYILSSDGTTVSRMGTEGGIGYLGTRTNHPLVITTNNTEAMRISSSGNVGIGASPSTKFHVKAGTNQNFNVFGPTVFSNGVTLASTTDGFGAYVEMEQRATQFAWHNGTTERMRLDSSGRVGIGTSSPETTLEVKSTGSSIAGLNTHILVSDETAMATNVGGGILFEGNYTTAGDDAVFAGIKALKENATSGQYGGNLAFYTRANGSLPSEAMRIDSSGNVGIGITPTVRLHVYGTAGNYNSIFRNGSDSGQGVGFQRADGTHVGSITWASTTVSFNTSSDHRLKENVVDLTGATTRLKQLEPKRFNFIADADTTVDGFLAHEVQSVVPEAIHGTKDEVDAEGNPVYQGIDQSKLVPLLVATIQELEARITALENA